MLQTVSAVPGLIQSWLAKTTWTGCRSGGRLCSFRGEKEKKENELLEGKKMFNDIIKVHLAT